MKRAALALTIIMLAGCAVNTGVIPMGQDTFMVARQAATGFSGSGSLKAEAFSEANQHCATQNKTMQVISTQEARPPFILGNYPKAEVQFKCVAK